MFFFQTEAWPIVCRCQSTSDEHIAAIRNSLFMDLNDDVSLIDDMH